MKTVNLDEFIDDLPLAVSQYRNKIKAEMITFGLELLELACEKAEVETEYLEDGIFIHSNVVFAEGKKYRVHKQSILDTINQVV